MDGEGPSTDLAGGRLREWLWITGPSGTGKELIARAIHIQRPRAARPFTSVTSTGLGGELFFAARCSATSSGAFTRAGQHWAKPSLPDGGTPASTKSAELDFDFVSQAALAALQDRRVTLVGSHESLPVDVRVVAATNRDLQQDVLRRAVSPRFVSHRLNVISVHAAPLIERQQDIPALAPAFSGQGLCVENGTAVKQFHPNTLGLMYISSLARQHSPVAEPDRTGRRVRRDRPTLAGMFFPSCSMVPIFPQRIEILSRACTDPAVRPFGRPASPPPEPWVEPVGPSEQAWLTLSEVEQAHIARTLQESFYNCCRCPHARYRPQAAGPQNPQLPPMQLPPTSPAARRSGSPELLVIVPQSTLRPISPLPRDRRLFPAGRLCVTSGALLSPFPSNLALTLMASRSIPPVSVSTPGC